MLGSAFVGLWVLSFFNQAYGLEERSVSLSICNINGTFAVGTACSENGKAINVSNGVIVGTSKDASSSTSIETSHVESTPQVHSASATSSSTSPSPSSSSPSSPSPSSPSPSSSSSGTAPNSVEEQFATTSSKSATSASTPLATSTSLPIIGNAPQPKGSNFTLKKLYQKEDFINDWDFFDSSDPTHGNVQYVNQQDAVSLGLIQIQGNTTIMKVDDTTQVPVGGKRRSVRISSKERVQGGLIVVKLEAMPTGCATWPAFWAVGDNWPSNGEIDIIEGVNKQSMNQMTLHTLPGCTREDDAKPASGETKAFTGTPLQVSCDVKINSNSGCGVMSTQQNTFGAGFNQNGGGVVATMWDTLGIRMWNFPNGQVPSDLLNMNPTPGIWDVPDAFFSSKGCPVDQYFSNLALVFDITLCGDFAGALYPSSGCPGTCAEQIADPDNFKEAQWKVEYVAVYE